MSDALTDQAAVLSSPAGSHASWKRPYARGPLWEEVKALARVDGLVLERALNERHEKKRGRYFIRDPYAESLLHGADTLKALRTWLMGSPAQRARTARDLAEANAVRTAGAARLAAQRRLATALEGRGGANPPAQTAQDRTRPIFSTSAK